MSASASELYRLLYVEDDATNIRLMARLMQHRPAIRLMVAEDGVEGLVTAMEARPRLILLDANLPDMSGEEFVGQLRDKLGHVTPPIVVLSADALPHRLEAFTLLNIENYLTKPYEIQQIYEIVDEYC